MIVSPPRAAQNVSAAPSSEDRSMLSSAWRSPDDNGVLDSCDNRSSAMKSLATDAIPTSWLLSLDSIWLVTRSRTAIEMVAPSAAAASVACAIRAGNPSNAAGGGASGAWTAGSGPSGEPYTFAQPVVDTVSTAAVAMSSIGGRARVVISPSCVPFSHVTPGRGVAAIRRDFAAWARSGTIDQLSPAVVGRTARIRLARDAPDARNPSARLPAHLFAAVSSSTQPRPQGSVFRHEHAGLRRQDVAARRPPGLPPRRHDQRPREGHRGR